MTKHRRGPWAQTEDRTLMLLVEKYGPQNWVRISQDLVSRSPKQCRERYHQNLKPSLNLEPISADEGILIERLVAEMGKRWAEIARRLRGRSDNAVKNWWNGGMNRRKRLDRGLVGVSSRETRPYDPQTVKDRHPAISNTQFPLEASGMPRSRTAERPVGYLHRDPQPHLRTLHILPSNTAQPLRILDPALPSPSSFSCASRGDSIDGGVPPSLVSDHSYSSYSISPKGCTPGAELPPLCIGQNHSRRESIPVVRITPTSTPYTLEDQQSASSSASSAKSPPYFHPHASSYSAHPHVTCSGSGLLNNTVPIGGADNWREQGLPSSKASDGSTRAGSVQRPLPDFRTISAPEPRAPEPTSPPRDRRMNLSSVML